MKVNNVMTKNVGFCRETDNLATAVGLMWQKDCGIVPILDTEDRVIGVITDRDVSIAVTTRNRAPSEISAAAMIIGKTITCSKNDSIKNVLKKMSKHQINRIPVVTKKGRLKGVISINDLLQMKKSKRFERQIFKTLKAIGKPSPILLREV
ncbi:MAG: CBS domain-containing protein [Pyrinomonadaceae bacterium]|nr:CBS domain-containing protein [Pyrinomonadaceae bacterium]